MSREPVRHRLQTDERRAQLLELGLKLFSARNYSEVSIDDIAREAGVSKGLLYHYFGGKRAFYVACVREAAARLLDEIEPMTDLPPGQRAQAGLEAYLNFVEQRASTFSALMHGGLGADEEIHKLIQDTRDQIVERMVEELGFEQPSEVFRMAARAWIGSVEAASLDWLERRQPPRAQLITYLLGTLYASMRVAQHLDPRVEFESDPQVNAVMQVMLGLDKD